MRRFAATWLAALLLTGPAHAAGTLRFGLEFDPAVLDPARNGSYTDRIVFNSMCDQLIDIDDKLNYVPQLATSWEWSADNLALTLHLRENATFQDGEPFTADAMRANLERYRNAPESIRKTELKPVTAVEVVDPHTLRLRLSAPYAPLLSVLANRPGTPLSPRILGRTPDQIANDPVCAGPYKFRERVAQDHITLDRFPGYWNASQTSLDRIVFRTILDPSVRLVNLQSGALDIVNRLAPTDIPAVTKDARLRLVSSPSLGFQIVSFNLAGEAANTPFAKDPRIREAFEKSIDRGILNDVVFEGKYVPSNQTEAPGSRYWDPGRPVPPRDLEGAKALLRQAGVTRVKLSMLIGNEPVYAQIGQVLQSMAAEAGFDVELQQVESATMVDAGKRGAFQSAVAIWSGRPDPDGNTSIWLDCKGFVNWTGYCSPALDSILGKAASTVDPEARVPLYRQATELWLADRPYMVLYHFTWFWGVSAKVEGFAPRPDGIARPIGLRLRE